MKKKRTAVKVAVLVFLIGIFVLLAIYFINVLNTETFKNQQNYMASRLMEMGAYEQGRMLAVQNNQMKKNNTAQELIVLAAGFQADYESGIRNAEAYLKSKSDDILQDMIQLYQKQLSEIKDLTFDDELMYQEERQKLDSHIFEELMALLFRIEETINAKVDNDTLQTMLDIMYSSDLVSYESLELLQKDHSALSMKVQVSGNLRNGNYGSAYETAKALYKKNHSFENKALLANITAIDGINLQSAGAEKAINFIETVTPVSERGTSAYNLERAYLYFYADKEKKSRDLLRTVLAASADHDETIAVLLRDFLYEYKRMNGFVEEQQYQTYQKNDLDIRWERIRQALYLIEKDNSFYEFVLSVMDELYNGLIIRNIDASFYPEVHLTVNVAVETENNLKKEDFLLKDMDAELKDFTVTSVSELDDLDAVSVALVVDHSGSMEGEPLENTKKAVVSFIKNIRSDIRVGLVAFDDTAQVITPMTDSSSTVLQGVRAIESGGGTSIWSGLQMAGDELMTETGRKIIILLSDGEDGDTSKIDGVLRQLHQSNIYVYTIGFGGADTEYLSYIANSCKGKFIQAKSSDMLDAVYAEIGSYMVNEYLIIFNAVTELDDFSRICSVSLERSHLLAEKNYHVGVDYDEIKTEETKKPAADYFREFGGSRKNTE